MTKASELSVTRFIAASPEKVWHAMTERQEEWWCPVPWRAEVVVQDKRAGGRCDMVFKGPDGEEELQCGIYLAYDEGQRFITTDAVTADFEPAGPFMIGIWEIAPEASNGIGGTRYTATARHWTEEACKQHADMGFSEGWGVCADQLKALCEEA